MVPWSHRLPFSDWPISRQLAAHFGIVGIIRAGLSYALERRHKLFKIHAQCIGDHTRGLFEAHASIVVSAAHSLEDVLFSFGHGHCLSSKGVGY